MSFWHNPACLMFAFTCMACGLTGCREVDPQPNLYVDLGEGDQRLLPTVSQPRDPRVKTGQAEFKAFLSPADKAAKPTKGGADSDQEDANDEILSEVRTLIDEYNEIIAGKQYDKAVDFYVPGQRETASAMFGIVREVEKAIDEMKSALQEKIPDGAMRIDKVFGALGGSNGAQLTVVDFKIVDDSRVEGSLPPIPLVPTTVTFRLMHDENEDTDFWYIDSPMLAEYDKYRQLVEMGKTQFGVMLEQIRSGAVPAETILQQLEASVKLMDSLTSQQSGGGGDEVERSKTKVNGDDEGSE